MKKNKNKEKKYFIVLKNILIVTLVILLAYEFILISLDITNQYRNLQFELTDGFTDGYSLYWATIFAAIIGVLGICLTIYYQQKESNKVKVKQIGVSKYEIATKSRTLWLDNIRTQYFDINSLITKLKNLILFTTIESCKKSEGKIENDKLNNSFYFDIDKIYPILYELFEHLNNLKLYINPNPGKGSLDEEINENIEMMIEITLTGYSRSEDLFKKEEYDNLLAIFDELTKNLRLYLKTQWDVVSKDNNMT